MADESEDTAVVLGIDVGGTKVAAAIVEGTAVRHRVERPTDITGERALLDSIAAIAREVVGATGAKPRAAGLGLPSQIDFETGTALSSVNIPLAGVPLRQELGTRLEMPVFVDNDANCAALAEAQLVPDPPANELVMLTLGTGVGGGIVIGGEIYRGATGLGAELGHLLIDGRTTLDASGDGFPRPGSLESLCSGTALEHAATRRAAERPEGALGQMLAERGRVSGRDAECAAREGDAEALEIFTQLGRWLGLGVAGVVNAFEPERVVVGGGLSRAADLFLDAARAEAARCALPELWRRTAVELARGGADAGVIGAATLAAQELARSGHTAEYR